VTRITRLNPVTTKSTLTQAIANIPTGGGGSGVPTVIAKLRAGLAIRNDALCPIVFCGSSTTEGQVSGSTPKRFVNRFIQRLQDAYPLDTGSHPATVSNIPGSPPSTGIYGINLGLGGATSSTSITLTSSSSPTRTASAIGALDPIAVFIQDAGNDPVNNVPASTTKTNFQARIDAIQAAASRPVLFIFWHGYYRWDDLTPNYPWSDYLQACTEIAAENADHVAVLDFVEDFIQVGIGIDSDRSNYLSMMADGTVHMNGKGHAFLADLMFSKLGFSSSGTGATPIGDTTPPTAPVLSHGTVTSNSIQWTWTSATDDVGVAGYRMFNADTDVQVGADLAAGATSKTETGLVSSTTYNRYVKAFDGSGNESAASNDDTATTEAGGAGYRASADPNLIADMNPANLALSDGALVASVPILSGSEAGKALANSTSSQQPTFKASAVNSLPALVFDGTNDKLTTSSWSRAYGPDSSTDPTPVTIFAVIKATAGDFCNGITSGVGLYARKTSTTTLNIYGGSSSSNVSKTDTTAYEVVCAVWNTSSSKLFVNQSTGPVTGTTGSSRLSGLRIGSNSGGTSNFLAGEVARLILVKGAVADADIATEMLALGTDYGITVT
jgi:lysophospholipase L1-like esterase